MIWPLPIEVTSSPRINGSNSRPERVGEAPVTICRKSGR